MAVSRPFVVALVGALLALAAFYATRGGREERDDSIPAQTPAAGERPRAERAPEKSPARPAPADASRGRGADARREPRAGRNARAAAPSGLPTDVTHALERNRTVVLFFHQRGAADDVATARAVASMRGRRGVQVFSAPIERLADYRAVTAGAGVSQAPAIVILRRGQNGRLVEGFVDQQSLAQHVADAR